MDQGFPGWAAFQGQWLAWKQPWPESNWKLLEPYKEPLEKKDILSVPKLITAIKELWTMELSTDYLKKLSDSMPGRFMMVTDTCGDMTKYWKAVTICFSQKIKEKINRAFFLMLNWGNFVIKCVGPFTTSKRKKTAIMLK
jgi:hypothetical protein